MWLPQEHSARTACMCKAVLGGGNKASNKRAGISHWFWASFPSLTPHTLSFGSVIHPPSENISRVLYEKMGHQMLLLTSKELAATL